MKVYFLRAVSPDQMPRIQPHLYTDCTYAGSDPVSYNAQLRLPLDTNPYWYLRLKFEDGTLSWYTVYACQVCLARWKQANERPKGRPAMKFKIYKDAKGEYRWRIKAGNNRIIGASGEGYTNKIDCLAGIDRIKNAATDAKVEDESDDSD